MDFPKSHYSRRSSPERAMLTESRSRDSGPRLGARARLKSCTVFLVGTVRWRFWSGGPPCAS